MPSECHVPLPALERLSTYIRCLMQLEHEGVESVSSHDMEQHTGVSAAQFRKDLSYFGEFGKRGIGYNVRELRERIAHLLQIDQEQNVLLVGAGHLGSALIAYPGWRAYRFRIAAVFDRDPAKIGTTIRRLTVQDIATLEEANRTIGAKIAILAIPAWEAQEVADRLVRAGVSGLINFAPVQLQVPEHVIVREVCFICELAILSHLIHHTEEERIAEKATRRNRNGRARRAGRPRGNARESGPEGGSATGAGAPAAETSGTAEAASAARRQGQ